MRGGYISTHVYICGTLFLFAMWQLGLQAGMWGKVGQNRPVGPVSLIKKLSTLKRIYLYVFCFLDFPI